ncbi:MAG: ACT domain-containing protein [Prevotellaceae bacterium]|nr:ACT domain-containing protein [Candidatus Minthosoma equi]
MTRALITVVGKDSVGIVAKVSTYLANNSVNILDISQTIVQDFFNMMMVVDIEAATKPLATLSEELSEIGSETAVSITIQLESIFRR